MLITNKTI